MTVKRGAEALSALYEALGEAPVRDGQSWNPIVLGPDLLLERLPGDFAAQRQHQGWLWAHEERVPPLRDPSAYVGPAEEPFLALSPAEGLAETQTAAQRRYYCRRSVDVTMKGGITSGVIYPLAICELARSFRFRSVGGASAGSIAAAAAAAAELGRATEADLAAGPAGLSDQRRREGHVRAGFAGYADCLAWLAQIDDPAPALRGADGPAKRGLGGLAPAPRQEYRLARLFRPTPAGAAYFRLLMAWMRGGMRRLLIPVLLLAAFGRWSLVASLAVGVVAVGAIVRSVPAHQGPLGVAADVAAALLGLSLCLAAALALLLSCVSAIKAVRARSDPVAADHDPVPDPGRAAGTSTLARVRSALAPLIRALGAPAALLAAGFGLWWGQRGGWWDATWVALIWVASVAGIGGVAFVSLTALSINARNHSFGLIAGASSPPQGLTKVLDRCAGFPRREPSDRPLVSWLSDTYNELAGLPPGQVLRFGHLWFGPHFVSDEPAPTDATDEAARARWVAYERAAADPLHRRVNLELVTTDLTHGLSYRFPMAAPTPDDRRERRGLYVRRADLTGVDPHGGSGTAGNGRGGRRPDAVFPSEVVDVVCAPHRRVTGVADLRSPDHRILEDLYELPEPWNMPVIVAVRLSLAFPGLIQAVRLHRIHGSAVVRDEFGRQLFESDRRVTYPPGTAAGPPGSPGSGDTATAQADGWAEEAWFSDGGITSNFPVHLFDAMLPRWPTAGINLGKHPPGFRVQDVWLPQDWQAGRTRGTPVENLTGFVGAIVAAARGSHDNAQMTMPSHTGRIATVRQQPWEGGSNLLMTRETIASLGLRGLLVGARLRRRFSSRWRTRHQWLRLRASAAILSRLSDDLRLSTSFGAYGSLLDHRRGVDNFERMRSWGTVRDPDLPPEGRWFRSSSPADFVRSARRVAKWGRRPSHERDPVRDGVPLPEALLRQMPPL